MIAEAMDETAEAKAAHFEQMSDGDDEGKERRVEVAGQLVVKRRVRGSGAGRRRPAGGRRSGEQVDKAE